MIDFKEEVNSVWNIAIIIAVVALFVSVIFFPPLAYVSIIAGSYTLGLTHAVRIYNRSR